MFHMLHAFFPFSVFHAFRAFRAFHALHAFHAFLVLHAFHTFHTSFPTFSVFCAFHAFHAFRPFRMLHVFCALFACDAWYVSSHELQTLYLLLILHTLRVLILRISGKTYKLKSTPNDRFFWATFHVNFINFHSFYQKLAERKRRKNTFSILFCIWPGSKPGFTSNKPTYCPLNHGDFKVLTSYSYLTKRMTMQCCWLTYIKNFMSASVETIHCWSLVSVV